MDLAGRGLTAGEHPDERVVPDVSEGLAVTAAGDRQEVPGYLHKTGMLEPPSGPREP